MNNKITPQNLPAKLSRFKNKILLLLGFAVSISIISFVGIRYFSPTKKSYSLAIAPEKIIGGIVTLRKLREEDFIDYHNMFSDIVRKNLEFPQDMPFRHTAAYLKKRLNKSEKGKSLHYIIFDNKTNKLIGGVFILETMGTAPGQFSCWINENYWGGGRFQEATKLITKTFFALKPQEKSFAAYVRLWNRRCHKALLNAGFVDVNICYYNGEQAQIMEMKNPANK
jgi:RimJ/RimL family protein N-acetyltransferase